MLSTIFELGWQQDCCRRGGWPRGKRKRLLFIIHSELAPVIKTTELPMQEHLPATLPHHQFVVMGSAMGKKRKGAGHREKATRWKTKKSSQAPREAFISERGGVLCVEGFLNKMHIPQKEGP